MASHGISWGFIYALRRAVVSHEILRDTVGLGLVRWYGRPTASGGISVDNKMIVQIVPTGASWMAGYHKRTCKTVEHAYYVRTRPRYVWGTNCCTWNYSSGGSFLQHRCTWNYSSGGSFLQHRRRNNVRDRLANTSSSTYRPRRSHIGLCVACRGFMASIPVGRFRNVGTPLV